MSHHFWGSVAVNTELKNKDHISSQAQWKSILYWKSWNIFIYIYIVQRRIIWKSQPRFNIHHVSLCHQKQKPERTTTPQNPKQPTDLSLSFKRRRLTKTQQTAVSRLKLLHHRCTHHVSFFLWTGTSYQSDVGSLLDEQCYSSPRRSLSGKKFEERLTDLWPELVSAENYKLYSVAARSA